MEQSEQISDCEPQIFFSFVFFALRQKISHQLYVFFGNFFNIFQGKEKTGGKSFCNQTETRAEKSGDLVQKMQ